MKNFLLLMDIKHYLTSNKTSTTFYRMLHWNELTFSCTLFSCSGDLIEEVKSLRLGAMYHLNGHNFSKTIFNNNPFLPHPLWALRKGS